MDELVIRGKYLSIMEGFLSLRLFPFHERVFDKYVAQSSFCVTELGSIDQKNLPNHASQAQINIFVIP